MVHSYSDSHKEYAMARICTFFRKQPLHRSVPRSPLALELLEDRTLLDHNAVAFFVNGYGGGNVPPKVMNHVTSLFDQAKTNDIIHNYDVYETNWNSPDPRSYVFSSSHLPT